MSSPSAPPPANGGNVQGAENVPKAAKAEEDSQKPAVTTAGRASWDKPGVDDSTAADLSADKDEDLEDADVEEGRMEKDEQLKMRNSVASSGSQEGNTPPGSPVRRATAPMPKTKPLWLYMIIVLVVISVIGALIITAVAATRGGLTKLALGFLIVFALVIVCVVPIACYTRANFFANGIIF